MSNYEDSAGVIAVQAMGVILSYIAALFIIYSTWSPSGFIGFIGALVVAIPVAFVIRLVLAIILGPILHKKF